MRPAVLAGTRRGLPHSPPTSASKWTGNANMATVGEWKRSRVQATGSAGGRLSVGGELEEEEDRGEGVSWDGRTVQTSCLITQTPSSLR